MKKQIVSLLTAAAVGLTPLAAFGSDALTEMKDLGVMNGYEDGEMHGDYKLTRAQAITMIMRASGFDDAKWYKSEVSMFADIPLSHWASGYVYKAAYEKMINGVSEEEYSPDTNVTYEQAAKMIIGVLGLGDENMVYPDDYMKKAQEIGMLKNINANTGDELSREQFAEMLCNVLDYEMKDTTLRTIIQDDMEEEEDEYHDYKGYGADFPVDGYAAMAEDAAVMPAPEAVMRKASAGGGIADVESTAAAELGGAVIGGSDFEGHIPIIDDGYDIDDPYFWDEQIAAGQLTAGCWSDFKNFSFWTNLMQNQEYAEMQQKWEIPIDIDRVSPDPEQSEDVLDLMFTIDTTGSMGDELAYIKEELKDVVIRLDTHVRVSCNYYRDFGDQYVVRSFPFSTNIDKVVRQISKQYASGGGDWEEAVDEALLDSINNHDWSESARSKLLFMVLDAPPHFEPDVVKNIQDAVESAIEKGIHIIPVASSGIDKETEFFLRTIALATGGTYIFLTDDSGIGYSHIEPTVGQYEVKLLNELILEVIKEYIGQDYDLPQDDDDQQEEDRDNDDNETDQQNNDNDNGEEQTDSNDENNGDDDSGKDGDDKDSDDDSDNDSNGDDKDSDDNGDDNDGGSDGSDEDPDNSSGDNAETE